jgi:hypothetical protein
VAKTVPLKKRTRVEIYVTKSAQNVLGQEASSVCSSTFFLVEKGQWVELYAHAEKQLRLISDLSLAQPCLVSNTSQFARSTTACYANKCCCVEMTVTGPPTPSLSASSAEHTTLGQTQV